MEEARRRDYLRALGVQVWLPRGLPASLEGQIAPPRQTSLAHAPGPPDVPIPAEGLSEPSTRPAAPVAADAAVEQAPKALDWDALVARVNVCRRCELHATRNRAVFGAGTAQARLMLIGEAPGADEDRLGAPFVGRAGQLLDRMLAAIGLEREQVFITNLLKCRPPGNRNPQAREIACCHDYLARQIELVRPHLLLSLGRFSAQTLLDSDLSVGRLRGRWWPLPQTDIALRVTYHPAYLLRSPEQKAKSWEDLVAVRQRLDGLDTG